MRHKHTKILLGRSAVGALHACCATRISTLFPLLAVAQLIAHVYELLRIVACVGSWASLRHCAARGNRQVHIPEEASEIHCQRAKMQRHKPLIDKL